MLTASGCVTVHGEREIIPTATRAEAAKALEQFTTAYNAADKAYDPALSSARVTGALGAINQAGLTSRSVNFPRGNAEHIPLKLSDEKFLIPEKAGWPRFFVVDADSNLDRDQGDADTRWLMLFTRSGPDQLWRVAYLTILSPSLIPPVRTGADGHAEPVAADAAGLARKPAGLSAAYTSYLETGKPADFAAGPHTSEWRAVRAAEAVRPGRTKQYLDKPLNSGDFAPLGLRTEDGGALVFFSSRSFERETAADGVRIQINPDTRALLKGEVMSSLTKERVSGQVALVPPAGGRTAVLARLTGLTSAKGS
ncbi:hypothetical protein [Streptomyces sp. CAU 1734]|uniref:hypothetical protein n=1 Tax=Streptomyces sp. CAU 1734 TaxID=3140360 RepID=UPI0032618F19